MLILPGYDNSGPEHWQSLWEKAHPEYRRVQQRSWTAPVCDDWVAALDVRSSAAKGSVVFLADSITDGRCSTRDDKGTVHPNLDQRWGDVLTR